MSTLYSLMRSKQAKEMRRTLERAFPEARFKVQIYENGEWDVWFSENMQGREAEIADALSAFDVTPEWFQHKNSKERTYLSQ